MNAAPPQTDYPVLRRIGEEGVLVEFGPALSEPANCATLAFAADLRATPPEWCLEVATALKSVFVRFDPLTSPHALVEADLADRLAARDWLSAGLPAGRTRWRIPVSFGGAHGPQLGEVADLVGLTEAAAIEALCSHTLRVLAMGFAPGMPYLGTLPEAWDIPRQTALTPAVPDGAIVVAVRQVVAFAVEAQTGWRQVGRGAYRTFDPARNPAFLFAAGDEVVFEPVAAPDLTRLRSGEIAMPASEPVA